MNHRTLERFILIMEKQVRVTNAAEIVKSNLLRTFVSEAEICHSTQQTDELNFRLTDCRGVTVCGGLARGQRSSKGSIISE